jgi:ABC-type transporter Mla subunit MlaD
MPVALPAAATEGQAALKASTEAMVKSASDNCNLSGTLVNFVDEATAEIVKGFKEASDAVLKASAEITKAINEALSEVGEVIGQINAAINDIANEIAQIAQDIVNGVISAVEGAAQQLAKQLELDNLESAAGGFLDDIGNAISEVSGAISEAVGAVVDAVGEITSALGEVVKKISQATCAGVTSVLGAVGGGISDNVDGLATAVAAAAPPSRRIQSNGTIVNFNVNKELPYADVTYQGETIRIYSEEATILQQFPEATIVQPADADGKEEFDATAMVKDQAAAAPVSLPDPENPGSFLEKTVGDIAGAARDAAAGAQVAAEEAAGAAKTAAENALTSLKALLPA